MKGLRFLPLALCLVAGAAHAAPEVRGKMVRVIDGDTIKIEVSVRVACLNTPEIRGDDYMHGIAARERAQELLGEDVIIRPVPSQDRYWRLLAHVETTTGEDLAKVLRREGHGVAYRNDEQEWCQ